MIFVHPEFQVGQQEVDNFVFVVVEQLCAPGWVVALWTIVEELICSAVKFVQTFSCVFNSVGVNNVQQYSNAHFVAVSIRLFRSFGRPKREEAAKKLDTW